MQTNPPWGKKYEWDNGSAGDCRKSIGSTWDRPNFAKDWFLHDNKAPVHKCVKFWLIAMWIDRGAPTWLLVFFFSHCCRTTETSGTAFQLNSSGSRCSSPLWKFENLLPVILWCMRGLFCKHMWIHVLISRLIVKCFGHTPEMFWDPENVYCPLVVC